MGSSPPKKSPPSAAHGGSRTPSQATGPRVTLPRSQPPGRQRPVTRHHATDPASCRVGWRLAARHLTPTLRPFPNTPIQVSPWRPLHLRGPGAASRPRGASFWAAGRSEVKGDRRARAQGGDALPGAWPVAQSYGRGLEIRAWAGIGRHRGVLGTGALTCCFMPSFFQNI